MAKDIEKSLADLTTKLDALIVGEASLRLGAVGEKKNAVQAVLPVGVVIPVGQEATVNILWEGTHDEPGMGTTCSVVLQFQNAQGQ